MCTDNLTLKFSRFESKYTDLMHDEFIMRSVLSIQIINLRGLKLHSQLEIYIAFIELAIRITHITNSSSTSPTIFSLSRLR